jgi:hypothetical protein
MMLLPLPLGETIENETGLQRLWGKREQLVY